MQKEVAYMPNINNSPNPANTQLRPTKIDNYADNKLGKGAAKVRTPKGEIYDQPGTKS